MRKVIDMPQTSECIDSRQRTGQPWNDMHPEALESMSSLRGDERGMGSMLSKASQVFILTDENVAPFWLPEVAHWLHCDSAIDIVIKAGTFPVSTIKTAEAVKVVENSQRDINIAFMNEIAIICDKMGIDTYEVLAGMNTKWNALGFKPGLVGGHCIGVDPYYLTNAAEKLGYHSQIILNGRQVNDSMGAYVADAAIKQMIEAGMAPKKATVIILGLTFKENCPDTRNSKVVDIINRLKEFDIDPVVTDNWADPEVAKHEYGVELVDFADIPKADCVIVAVGHNEYRSMSTMQLKRLFKEELPDDEKVLVDVKSLYRMDELEASGMRFWRL